MHISLIPSWPGNEANTHSCIHTPPHSTSLLLHYLMQAYTHTSTSIIPHSEKLSEEKTFANLMFCSTEFGGLTLFGDTCGQFMTVFSVKILFSTNLGKFSPAKVSRYTLPRPHCISLSTHRGTSGATYPINTRNWWSANRILFQYCLQSSNSHWA